MSSGVGVLVAAYNAQATIGRAVRSALAQSAAVEVLVADDASTDATADCARACDDGTGRLRVMRFEANRGPSAARNRLLAESSAAFVCVLDADDYMRPHRLEALRAAADDGGWDMVADDIEFVAEHREEVVVDHLFPAGQELAATVDAAAFVRRCMNDPERPRRELAFIKPLIRRDLLRRTGVSYDERLRIGEDYVLYAQCLIRGARLRLTAPCGYVAVQRPRSLSGVHGTADLGAFLAADVRLQDEAPAGSSLRRALVAHARQLKRNHDFRRMIDLRREGDLPSLLALMARAPDSTRHAVGQALAQRLRTGTERAPPAAAAAARSGPGDAGLPVVAPDQADKA